MASCNILILGGTADARRLAEQLAGDPRIDATLSLAGRTAQPKAQPGRVRVGGFGGSEGLARYLRDERIDILVDATHPFAERISANALAAAQAEGVPLIALERPVWQAQPGDQWIAARDAFHAASLLGEAPVTVFLSIGRQNVAPFAAQAQHRYIVRSVDPVAAEELPSGASVILARGPFDIAAERQLLETHGVNIIVSKNSGGDATYAKIEAARALGLPVVMIERTPSATADPAHDVETVLGRIRHLAGLAAKRGE